MTARIEPATPAAIARAAQEARSPLCQQALDLFVALYGAEAGNLALKLLSTAGLYIGGGIAPKILPKLQDGAFLEAFRSKGRMRELMGRIPVRVVLEHRAGLLGAACTGAYARTGSIWPPVAIHWLTVVLWKVLFAGPPGVFGH